MGITVYRHGEYKHECRNCIYGRRIERMIGVDDEYFVVECHAPDGPNFASFGIGSCKSQMNNSKKIQADEFGNIRRES